ncbi:MAG: SH3 domain-containing protein [Actinomycetota bacterium]
MASSELKQLERELEAAAVQLSIADKELTNLSKTDPGRSAEVSEARVVSAAKSALAVDVTAPIGQLLDGSRPHPMLEADTQGQWHAFIGRVRSQLGLDRPPSRIVGPLSKRGEDPDRKVVEPGRRLASGRPVLAGDPPMPGNDLRRPKRRTGAAAAVLVVAVGVGLGAVLLAVSWLADDGGCEGLGCNLSALGEQASSNDDRRESTTTTERSIGDGGTAQGGISASEATTTSTAPETGDAADGSASTERERNGRATTTTVARTTTAPTSAAQDAGSTTERSSASSTPTSRATTTAAPSTSAPQRITATTDRPTTTARATTTAAPTTTAPETTTTTRPATTTTTAAPVNGGGIACPSGNPTLSLNVVRVASDDVLNIRLGPGTGFSIISSFAYDATGVQVYGGETSGSWVMVQLPGVAVGTTNGCGWAHSAFLAAPGTPI